MHDFDWSSWTDWTNLSSLDMKTVPAGPGAYILATDRPINRAVETDPLGILDIGESKGLRQRLNNFKRCATKRHAENHMAGWRYQFFHFYKHYPFDTLRIRWASAESKDAAYRLEGQIMLAYLQRHSELPPLNYSFNWSPFRESGWDIFDD